MFASVWGRGWRKGEGSRASITAFTAERTLLALLPVPLESERTASRRANIRLVEEALGVDGRRVTTAPGFGRRLER